MNKKQGRTIHQSDKTVTIAIDGSTNHKTGDGVQVWILDSTMHPHESRVTGNDSKNQCKGCQFAGYNGCYVITPSVTAIYNAWKRDSYPHLHMGDKGWDPFFEDKYVRLGAYGNPSVLPLAMLESITTLAKSHTGYFHDWHLMSKEKAQAYGKFLMASTEEGTRADAKALGLRTFTTGGGDLSKHGIECPADTKGIQCVTCHLCDGNSRDRPLPDVWINPHGYQVKKAKL